MSFDKWNGLTGMGNVISIGNQSFDSIRENNYFFIDKSSLIKEWWDSGDVVTLIIRPRRFGKTLNMSMLNCFFSSKYAGRSDLFKGLSIWDDSSYRDIQGTYPVIYLSFADVKQTSYAEAVSKIKSIILEMYSQYERMIDKDTLTDSQRQLLSTIKVGMDDIVEVYFEEDDEIEKYKLVTSIRGNSMENRISIESPIGMALKGHKVGDRVEVKVNDNYSYFLEIRSIDKTGSEDEEIRGF